MYESFSRLYRMKITECINKFFHIKGELLEDVKAKAENSHVHTP